MIRLKSLLTEGNVPIANHPELIPTAVDIAQKLVVQGFSKAEAAAIVGNMWAESTLNPTAGKETGPYGLIQWRGDRLDALKKYAELIGGNISDLQTQIWFLKIELKNGYKSSLAPDKGLIPGLSKNIKDSPNYEVVMFNRAMSPADVQDKALGFAEKSERMGDAELKLSKKSRMESAQTIYDNL